MALDTLIRHAELACIETDTNLRVVSWNQGATQLFGYLEDQSMGRQLSDLVSVDRQQLLDCRTTRHTTRPHTNFAGEQRRCEIFFTPVMNFKGKILG